jgi:hypothetical protein
MCKTCNHHQPWQGRGLTTRPSSSQCRQCDRRNRFYPRRFGIGGNITETRGRPPAVVFRRRPSWTIIQALVMESRQRNHGVIEDEDELILQETHRLRDRVQKRIEDLELLKEGL